MLVLMGYRKKTNKICVGSVYPTLKNRLIGLIKSLIIWSLVIAFCIFLWSFARWVVILIATFSLILWTFRILIGSKDREKVG